ncbi:alpha/beta hydrolase [Fulvivirga sp. M361]|uniref:alpha/beta hydrolase n=1 Tax=Fulvivirga sp. M361 TaxID=2594266 RepID=UPI00117BCBDD|nr:alpha/beta hydrolase [Fulvivirga sp. M361]TRX58833.1 alpha/beta hydrolase [Fulvivirga sp. M361]
MKRPVLLTILTLGFFLDVSCQETTYTPVKYPDHYNAEVDLIYTQTGHWEGRMDIYTNPVSEKPTPVVINIHGGGWNHGVKESQTGFGYFFKEGFAVANVEYRLVDVSPAPGAIEDLRCALVYLCKHAKEFNIDTSKIVVMGASTGGHLALMTGLLGNNRKFDTNCAYDANIKIAAIIDRYGPSDLTLMTQSSSSVKRWLGDGYKNREFIESVSPLYYVDKNSPPTFIVHGTKDPLVPYEQSVLLYEKLKINRIKTELITIEGGSHGKFSKEKRLMLNEKMWGFLKELELAKN